MPGGGVEEEDIYQSKTKGQQLKGKSFRHFFKKYLNGEIVLLVIVL